MKSYYKNYYGIHRRYYYFPDFPSKVYLTRHSRDLLMAAMQIPWDQIVHSAVIISQVNMAQVPGWPALILLYSKDLLLCNMILI